MRLDITEKRYSQKQLAEIESYLLFKFKLEKQS